MGFNIKNNYGPNIDNHDGGVVNLRMGRDGRWTVDAEEAEIIEDSAYSRISSEVSDDIATPDNPVSTLDTIFHRALNIAKVKKAIEQIVIMKGEEGKYRLSVKQAFVLHKVLEEICWLDDDTDTKFIEWFGDVYGWPWKARDFKSVLAPFKHSHSTTWGADTVKDRQTGRDYRELADYVRSQFVSIGKDGQIEDKVEFMNLGSDGKPMYIGRGLKRKM